MSTGKKLNGPYEALDRGHAAKVWVTEPDGNIPLIGEVRSCKDTPGCGIIIVYYR